MSTRKRAGHSGKAKDKSPLTEAEQTLLAQGLKVSQVDLIKFRNLLLVNGPDEVKPPWYHKEWSDILLFEKGNFAVEGFRESGKGQITLRAYSLHCLRFPTETNDYFIIIKQNADLASAKLLEIEDEYLSNPTLCANLIKIRKKTGSIFSVDVKGLDGKTYNVRIESYGKGSAIRGLANIDRRPRIALLDDIQDTADARSDKILDDDWKWFLSDIVFLGKSTRIFLIGNNLGEKCVVERAAANAKDLGFEFRKVAILNDKGESNWPEKFDVAFIEREKESYRRVGQIDIWMRERMCEASSEETRVFDKRDFIRYSYLYVVTIIKDTNIFITIDPASSKDKAACFRAICVNAVTDDNRWIIIDFPYGRWPADEFIDKMFDTVIKWTPKLSNRRRIPVGIEKGHFKQILEPFIYKEMQRRNVFFDIVPIEHIKEGTKLERVKMLAPRFKAKTIMLPESALWLAELESELMGVTIDGFKSLFTDLCFAKGTKIATAKGNKNIEDITNKDLVITPFGLRKVKSFGFTGMRKTINRFGLSVTPNHKIFCYEKGFASVDTLCYDCNISNLNAKEMLRWKYLKLLNSMERNSFLTGRESITALIKNYPTVNFTGTDFINRCGNFIIRGRFQKASMFIISTAMFITTTYLTLSVYRLSNIIKYLRTLILYQLKNILLKLDHLQLLGINPQKVRLGINNTLSTLIRIKNLVFEGATFAIRNINIFTQHQNTVLQGAYNDQLQTAEGYTKKENVSSVKKSLSAGNISHQRLAQEDAQQHSVGKTQSTEKDVNPVYNLTVEQDGVYYANGVLVSNCDALAMQQQIAKPPMQSKLRPRGQTLEVTGYNPLTATYDRPESGKYDPLTAVF